MTKCGTLEEQSNQRKNLKQSIVEIHINTNILFKVIKATNRAKNHNGWIDEERNYQFSNS